MATLSKARSTKSAFHEARKPASDTPAATHSAGRGEFQVVRTRRTFEEVASQVRELLFKGSLRPGDRLPPERELSTLLGVGRPALREAMRALEVSGLIELRKGKTGGAFIADSNSKVVAGSMSDMLRLGNVSVEELFEAREWILSALVRPACRRITPEEILALKQNITRAEKLHAEGRFEERIEENFEFYEILAETTRNPVAMVVMQGLTQTLRSLIDEVGGEIASNFFGNRRDLLKALEAHDEDTAARYMTRIVKATEQTYKRLVQQRLSPRPASANDGEGPAAAARRKTLST